MKVERVSYDVMSPSAARGILEAIYWKPAILWVSPDSLRILGRPLAKRRGPDSTVGMIRAGFLDPESRRDLIELARDGSAAHRLARRANALVLLDRGMSCSDVAKV